VFIPLDRPGPPVQRQSWFGVKVASVTKGLIEILQNFSARNIRREIFVAMLGPGEQRRSDGEHLRPPRQAGAGRDR
jgi:hypothetical protein